MLRISFTLLSRLLGQTHVSHMLSLNFQNIINFNPQNSVSDVLSLVSTSPTHSSQTAEKPTYYKADRTTLPFKISNDAPSD